MPLYLFENVKTGEVREIVFRMNDVKIYNGENNDEQNQWERRWTVPQASIDTVINPESANDFIEKTGKKRGNLGQILDASKELSAKREAIMGKDPIKENHIAKWKASRKGQRMHPSEVQRNIEISS